MTDDQWRELLNQLSYLRFALQELLRRVPEQRCKICGLAQGLHEERWDRNAGGHGFQP